MDKLSIIEDLVSHNIPIFPVHRVQEDMTCTCHRRAFCPNKGNHPAINDWLSNSSCNLDSIRSWIDRFDYGIPTGSISKLIALEIDKTIIRSGKSMEPLKEKGFISSVSWLVEDEKEKLILIFAHEDKVILKTRKGIAYGINLIGESSWVKGPYSKSDRLNTIFPLYTHPLNSFYFPQITKVPEHIYKIATELGGVCF